MRMTMSPVGTVQILALEQTFPCHLSLDSVHLIAIYDLCTQMSLLPTHWTIKTVETVQRFSVKL